MLKYFLFGAFILIAILVFIKLSSLRHHGKPMISLSSRIVISLFFPVVGLVIILLGSFILVLVVSLFVLILLFLFLVFLLSRPKVYVFKKKF
ncbi:MAG: hypothetical protein QXR60_00130 [Candidatus Nanoarchaeia archaeon]